MQRIIKKYANRKLYDTEHSRYVTLTDIVDSVLSGLDVIVVDQKTKIDVTGPTLAQAILGNEKDFYNPQVVEKLKEIIKVGGIAQYSKRN